MELKHCVRVYSKNFITDFLQDLKNIIGGRLKAYENMMSVAIEETWQEFKSKYPNAENIRVDTEQLGQGSVMVTITGVVP